MTLTRKHCNLPNKMLWLQITTKYQRINTQPMKIKTKHEHDGTKITKIEKKNKAKLTALL